MNQPTQIVPGIIVDAKGQATVDASMHDVLFDLALALEEPTDLPVDMQHVVAALMLASRDGQVNAAESIRSDEVDLIAVLIPHVKTVFKMFGGQLGADE
ncbi:MAG: hypothetical protein WBD20_10190 [Pirellulaceae bacterium]